MRTLLRRNSGLLALNAILLMAVVLFAMDRPAGAQNSAQPPSPTGRARGDYTMVSGRTPTGGGDAVYIIDVANQDMVALRWDTSKQSFTGIGYRDIAADAKIVPGR